MSCDGTAIGLPLDGAMMLFVASINNFASICASCDNTKCTAIWSPSKSALNAEHTSGWSLMAFPSINVGSKAWIESLCNVGALFKRTGWFLIISSINSHTFSSSSSTIFLATFIFEASSLFTSSLIKNGLYNSNAIFLGSPHWFIFKFGPTTITDLPE